jgi:DNA mismatch endonuclease (patch repair protein)
MDIYNRKKRSEIMSKVRAIDTKPEMVVRRILYLLGYRFRLHRQDLPGKPDIILPRYRSVVLVHGCFWHHHARCGKSKLPATNVKFWTDKILRNVQRDQQAIAKLRRSGWRVLVVWECEARASRGLAEKLVKFLERSNSPKYQHSPTKTECQALRSLSRGYE